MKEIENATIIKLNDNTYAGENDHIVSVYIKYENGGIQGTIGYRGKSYENFINNLTEILEIEEKEQIVGNDIKACTEKEMLLAIGNQLGTKWIDLKQVSQILEGDIISYMEEKEEEQSR